MNTMMINVNLVNLVHTKISLLRSVVRFVQAVYIYSASGAIDCSATCPTGTYTSGTTSVCDLCEVGRYNDEVGSGDCKKCGENGYQDERGEKSCKDNSIKLHQLNRKRVPMAGFGHFREATCNVSFEKSEGVGCQFANLKYCAQASMAVHVGEYTSFSSQVDQQTGCAGDCARVGWMLTDVRWLFGINAFDMVFEIAIWLSVASGLLLGRIKKVDQAVIYGGLVDFVLQVLAILMMSLILSLNHCVWIQQQEKV